MSPTDVLLHPTPPLPATALQVDLEMVSTATTPPAEAEAEPSAHPQQAEKDAEAKRLADATRTAAVLDAAAVLLAERPRRASLRELADEALMIDAILEAAEGDLTPELEARLDALTEDLTLKADGIGDWRETLQAEVNRFALEKNRFKAETDRLAAIEKSAQARLARFDERTKQTMQRMGRLKLEGDVWTITVQSNPPKLIVDNADAVPASYVITETVKSVDTAALKEELIARKKADEALEKVLKKAATDEEREAIRAAQPARAAIDGAHLEVGTTLRAR